MTPRAALARGLGELSLELPTDASDKLIAYLDLLAKWNKTYNLTAIRDPREMVGKHLLDSLAMHPFVDGIAAAGGALADLGTGPGLPGIPLAIAKPGLQVSLVESNGKKVRFLREAVRKLGLRNVTVVESRIEAFDAPEATGWRKQFNPVFQWPVLFVAAASRVYCNNRLLPGSQKFLSKLPIFC